MKTSSLLILMICLATWAQAAPSSRSSTGAKVGNGQAGTSSGAAGQRAQRSEQMQAMCKEHIEAMKTDVQKMHSALDKMKGNVAAVSNSDEKARWESNIEMWQIVVDHHDQMLKYMQGAQTNGMGCGMMMGETGMSGSMRPPFRHAPANASAMPGDDGDPQ